MQKSDHLESQAQLTAALEALRKAEQKAAAGQVALELMHEIRNPLEALGYLIYLIGESPEQSQTVREHLRLAEEQLAVLNRITNQTLGLARTSVNSSADLAALTESALRVHHHKVAAKEIRLVRDLHSGVVARVHMGEMLQVISNLIANAIDALPANGSLHVRLRKRRGTVHLVIADNGHGIAAEHLDQIFRPFFSTKGERGTGLGLALSKNIVERHEGSIRVRTSVRPGRSGTCFHISLPV